MISLDQFIYCRLKLERIRRPSSPISCAFDPPHTRPTKIPQLYHILYIIGQRFSLNYVEVISTAKVLCHAVWFYEKRSSLTLSLPLFYMINHKKESRPCVFQSWSPMPRKMVPVYFGASLSGLIKGTLKWALMHSRHFGYVEFYDYIVWFGNWKSD